MMLDNWPQSERAFKEWLSNNALEVLRSTGIREGQTVLDYGCGSGVFAIPTAKIVGQNGKVYAVDIDPNALDTLRKKANDGGLTNIEAILVPRNEDALPWLKDKVDAILLYDVLQVIDDKLSLLRDLRTALKEAGFLSIFAMHVGVKKTLQMAQQNGLFTLQDQRGMLLNFEIPHKRSL